ISSRFWMTCSLASSSRLSFKARFFRRTNSVSRFGQARWKTFSTSIICSMIFAWFTFRGIPSSTSVSISGLNLWASTAESIASFQSSTVISSGTSWPLLEYSRKALPTSVRVSIERKTSPQGQWKKRGILPSVLPCVPLPLPGAPKRMNVLYFMRGTFFYKTNSTFLATVVPSSLVIPSFVEGSRCVTLKLILAWDLLRRNRIDIHSSSRPIEAHVPIDQRKNGVVATKSDVFTRQKFRPPLPHNNVTGDNQLAPKFLHAQSLADAIAPVLYATLSFFVSHDYSASFLALFFPPTLIDLIFSRVSLRRCPTVR